MGIVFNLLAIATLLWPPKRLKSHFHGMVVQLLLIESISVILDLNHSVRVLRHGTQCGNILSAVWAAYVLHPLEKMLKYCSIFIMVIIAKEQTNALRSPSAYQYNLQER